MSGLSLRKSPGKRTFRSFLFGFLIILVASTALLLVGCSGVTLTAGAPNSTPSGTPSPAPASAVTKVFATDSTGKFFVLNVESQSLTSFSVPDGPNGMAIAPDGSKAYVAQIGKVAVVDTKQGTVIAEIKVPTIPANISSIMGVAISPDGKSVYVADTNDGSVVVIDASANAVVNTINTDSAPWAVAFSADGAQVYVSLLDFSGAPIGGPHHENAIVVIDARTQTMSKKLPNLAVNALAASPTRSEVYGVFSEIALVVISTETNEVLGQIPLDNDQQEAVAVSPDGKLIYVIGHGMVDIGHVDPPDPTVPSTVWVMSADSRSVLAKAHTDPGLMAVALSPDGNTAYLLADETTAAGLRTMDTRSLTFEPVQALAGSPMSLAVTSH